VVQVRAEGSETPRLLPLLYPSASDFQFPSVCDRWLG